jgi:hypothetical protein
MRTFLALVIVLSVILVAESPAGDCRGGSCQVLTPPAPGPNLPPAGPRTFAEAAEYEIVWSNSETGEELPPPTLAPPLPAEEAHMPVLRSVLVKPFVFVRRHRPRLFWRRPIFRRR